MPGPDLIDVVCGLILLGFACLLLRRPKPKPLRPRGLAFILAQLPHAHEN